MNLTAFDVETKGKADLFGLQPWRAKGGAAWLTTCAVAYMQGDDLVTEGLVRPTFEQLDQWLDTIIASGNYVVCWNAPFDIGWLIALGHRAKVMQVKWLDGLLLYRHLINTPRFRPEGNIGLGLKPAVAKFLPMYADYADDIDYDDESPENIEKLLTYNKRDSQFTLTLALQFLAQMPSDQKRCALIEALSLPLVADANVAGLTMDKPAIEALGVALENQRMEALVRLTLAHPNDVSEKVLNSPLQLRELLFKKWGLPVVDLTDTGNPSTDKATLHELALQDPRAALVHKYRDGTYGKAKFAVSPLASLEYNGDTTHPIAKVFGTYTGRMTYSSKTGRGAAEVPTGIAIHQWKRDPVFRDTIIAPDGYTLMEFDFAGQEFRWMAVESNDQTMLSMCMPGEDAHAFMGGRCTQVSYAAMQQGLIDDNAVFKPKRQLGKVANLSCQYRTSPPTLVTVAGVQHNVKLSLPQARAIVATYRTTYRAVPKYWERQIEFARKRGYVATLAGRRINLGMPDTWKFADGKDAKWSHESTAINFPIQGIGADQKYLALAVLRDAMVKYDARFYFELHDGMFIVAPTHYAERAAAEFKAILSDLPYKKAWGVDLPIQFPVDGKLGRSWGSMKEVQ